MDESFDLSLSWVQLLVAAIFILLMLSILFWPASINIEWNKNHFLFEGLPAVVTGIVITKIVFALLWFLFINRQEFNDLILDHLKIKKTF